MASSPGLVELSHPPEVLTDPFGSFPLSDPTIILGDTEVEASSPILPYTNISNTTTTHHSPPPPVRDLKTEDANGIKSVNDGRV